MQIEVTRRANWWPLLFSAFGGCLVMFAIGLWAVSIVLGLWVVYVAAEQWAAEAYRAGAEDGLAVAADLQRREEPGHPRRKLRGECDRRVTSIAHTNGMREVVSLRIEVE